MKEFKVYKYPIDARMTSIEVPDDSRVTTARSYWLATLKGTLLFQGGSYVAHYFYRRDD